MQSHSLGGTLGEKSELDRTILDTARKVFETYGVRRANIEDVAARAGVSRSFPSKDDLFENVVRREAELFFTTLDRATTGCTPQEAVVEAFALGVRLVQDSPLYSRIVESEPELFGLFSRSHVFPIGRFADGIAHTLRRCGADIPESDLANIADVLLRVRSGRRARLRRPLSGPDRRRLARVRVGFGLSVACISL